MNKTDIVNEILILDMSWKSKQSYLFALSKGELEQILQKERKKVERAQKNGI